MTPSLLDGNAGNLDESGPQIRWKRTMRKTRAMSLLEACLVVPRGRHGDGHHLIRLQVLLDAAGGETLHIAHKCSAGNISMTPSLALCDNFIISDVVKVCWNISLSTSYPSTPPQQQTTRPSLSSGWLRNKHWAAPKTNTDRTAAKLRYLPHTKLLNLWHSTIRLAFQHRHNVLSASSLHLSILTSTWPFHL